MSDVQFMSMRRESGKLPVGELASKMSRLKVVGENLTEEERASFIHDLNRNLDDDVDFESFLRVSHYCFIKTTLSILFFDLSFLFIYLFLIFCFCL
jgi:hypothetical protein